MDDDRTDRTVRSKHVLEHLAERFPLRARSGASSLDVLPGDLDAVACGVLLDRMPLELEGVSVIHLEDAQAAITKWRRIRAAAAALVLPGWVLEHIVLGLGRHKLNDIATIIFSRSRRTRRLRARAPRRRNR